jgi:hypothetical protein
LPAPLLLLLQRLHKLLPQTSWSLPQHQQSLLLLALLLLLLRYSYWLG